MVIMKVKTLRACTKQGPINTLSISISPTCPMRMDNVKQIHNDSFDEIYNIMETLRATPMLKGRVICSIDLEHEPKEEVEYIYSTEELFGVTVNVKK